MAAASAAGARGSASVEVQERSAACPDRRRRHLAAALLCTSCHPLCKAAAAGTYVAAACGESAVAAAAAGSGSTAAGVLAVRFGAAGSGCGGWRALCVACGLVAGGAETDWLRDQGVRGSLRRHERTGPPLAATPRAQMPPLRPTIPNSARLKRPAFRRRRRSATGALRPAAPRWRQ